MQQAGDTFRKFLNDFPDSPARPEAYGILGDIYGADGMLDEATDCFRKAMESATTMTQVNYGVFQVARLLELEQRWDQLIAWFEEYMQKYGGRANFTEAAYWIGTAERRKGNTTKSLEIFFDTITHHGNHPRSYGVDMMIRDLIEEHESLRGLDDHIRFMRRLYEAMDDAARKEQRTLTMRLTTLFARTEKDLVRKGRLVASLMWDRNIRDAGPITLALMGESALASGQKDFARKVYDQFVKQHGESDLALYALKGMAELEIAEGRLDQSLPLLEDLAARFATQYEGGWAHVRLGDLYSRRNEYERAEAEYKTVLGVKAWRGELWPQALLALGDLMRNKGEPAEAFAYYQRVYIMYQGFPEWAGRAYLASAECLEALNKTDEAVNTYQEVLRNPATASTPAALQAQAALKRLRGEGT